MRITPQHVLYSFVMLIAHCHLQYIAHSNSHSAATHTLLLYEYVTTQNSLINTAHCRMYEIFVPHWMQHVLVLHYEAHSSGGAGAGHTWNPFSRLASRLRPAREPAPTRPAFAAHVRLVLDGAPIANADFDDALLLPLVSCAPNESQQAESRVQVRSSRLLFTSVKLRFTFFCLLVLVPLPDRMGLKLTG